MATTTNELSDDVSVTLTPRKVRFPVQEFNSRPSYAIESPSDLSIWILATSPIWNCRKIRRRPPSKNKKTIRIIAERIKDFLGRFFTLNFDPTAGSDPSSAYNPQQHSDNGNDQQNVNDSTWLVSQVSDCPQDDKNNGEQV